MPNPKTGTVVEDVVSALEAFKVGDVTLRTDRYGIVRAKVGNLGFNDDALLENIRAFLVALSANKPEGAKGKYFVACHMSSSMGQNVKLSVRSCDPTSNYFMIPEKPDNMESSESTALPATN